MTEPYPEPGPPVGTPAPVPPMQDSPPKELAPAGIVTRFLAAIVDGVVIVVLIAFGYGGWIFFRLILAPRRFTWPSSNVWFSLTAFLVVAAIYLSFFWANSGRTVGDALLGIRVVSSGRRLLRWTVCILRAVFCVLFPIGLFWSIVDRKRRSVQDLLLRTTVVYDWKNRELPVER